MLAVCAPSDLKFPPLESTTPTQMSGPKLKAT